MTWTTEPTSDRLSARLDAEWEHHRRQPSALRTAQSWSLPIPSLRRINDLQEIVDATQARASEADAILAALVGVGRHDQLAGRIVLQRILPGLIVSAVRFRAHDDPRDPVDVAIPMAWEAIRRYDALQRPHQIAAALISDAVFRGFRGPHRLKSRRELALPPALFAETTIGTLHDNPRNNPIIDLARVMREARDAGLPQEDIDFVRDLVSVGSSRGLAEKRGVTTRTIRNHRKRAVARIRAAVEAA